MVSGDVITCFAERAQGLDPEVPVGAGALVGLAVVVLPNLVMMGAVFFAIAIWSRRIIAITLSTAAAFSIVLLVLVGLDRPLQHLTVSQAAMFDLQEDIRRSMKSQP